MDDWVWAVGVVFIHRVIDILWGQVVGVLLFCFFHVKVLESVPFFRLASDFV